MEKVVLSFLLGAAVGIGAYVTLRGSAGDADLVATRDGAAPVGAEAGSPGARRDDGAVDRPDVADARSSPADSSRPFTPIRAGAGDAILRGRVIADDGAGVGGVRIEARPIELSSPAEEPRADDAIEVWIEKSRRLELARRAARARAISAANGSFVLEGLDEDARYLLSARAAGWVIRLPAGASFGLRPGADLVLEAIRGAEVTFDIRDESGAQPPRATIVHRTGSALREFGWSPDQPAMTFEPGPASISVRRDPDLRATAQAVELGLEPVALRFELRRVPMLRGRSTSPVRGPTT
ncbi:MAG: hypothetical protein R3F20_06905 [Planctomycetota bacterium]